MDPNCIIGVLEHAIEVRRVSMARFYFQRGETLSSDSVKGTCPHNLEVALDKEPAACLIEFYTATVVVAITMAGEIELARQNDSVSKKIYVNPQVIGLTKLKEAYPHQAEVYEQHLQRLGPGSQAILPAGQQLGHDRPIFARGNDATIQLHFTAQG